MDTTTTVVDALNILQVNADTIRVIYMATWLLVLQTWNGDGPW